MKVAVSGSEKESYHEDEEIEEAVYFEPDLVPLVPRFIEEKTEAEGKKSLQGQPTWYGLSSCDGVSGVWEETYISESGGADWGACSGIRSFLRLRQKCVRVSDIRGFVGVIWGRG